MSAGIPRTLRVLSNQNRATLLGVLQNGLQLYTSSIWAVAYVSKSGVTLLEKALDLFFRRGGGLTVLTTGQGYVTDPEALRQLRELGAIVRLRPHDRRYKRGFHAKVYLFQNKSRRLALIGSGNLSAGGLVENDELAIAIEDAPTTTRLLDDLTRTVLGYNDDEIEGFLPLTDEVLEEYENAWTQHRPRSLPLVNSAAVTKLRDRARAVRSFAKRARRRAPGSEYFLNTRWPRQSNQSRIDLPPDVRFQQKYKDALGRVLPGDYVFLYQTSGASKDHHPGAGRVFGLARVLDYPEEDRDARPFQFNGRRYRFNWCMPVRVELAVDPVLGLLSDDAKHILGLGGIRFPGGISRALDRERALELRSVLERLERRHGSVRPDA